MTRWLLHMMRRPKLDLSAIIARRLRAEQDGLIAMWAADLSEGDRRWLSTLR